MNNEINDIVKRKEKLKKNLDEKKMHRKLWMFQNSHYNNKSVKNMIDFKDNTKNEKLSNNEKSCKSIICKFY